VAAVLVALAYLAGSIPFGVLVTRWRLGVDVRAQGSGNIGATNVARVGGKKLSGSLGKAQGERRFDPYVVSRCW
jgi:glycerol-3-phosphate acyltransferase PlsY